MSQPDPERSAPPVFQQNEHWLDKAISDARKDGAFENLPNTGKPLKLDEFSVDSEYDLAFTMLKNAGVSPYWMEMQKDTDEIQGRMQQAIDRIRTFLIEASTELNNPTQLPPVAPSPKSRWSRIFGRAGAEPPVARPRFERVDLARARDRSRLEYLEMAAELDAHLVKYHQSLPSNLWHLQRYRRSPEEFAAIFDTEVPQVDDLLTGEALDVAPADR